MGAGGGHDRVASEQGVVVRQGAQHDGMPVGVLAGQPPVRVASVGCSRRSSAAVATWAGSLPTPRRAQDVLAGDAVRKGVADRGTAGTGCVKVVWVCRGSEVGNG
jgi:hypothetical protein